MRFKAKIVLKKCNIIYTTVKLRTLKPRFVMGLRPGPLVWMRTHYLLQNIRTGRNVVRVHLFELLGSSERKWGVAGVWKIYPVELQERARLHFPYTTYYHVESVLQKRLKRQDHPLLIVSISIYNSGLFYFLVLHVSVNMWFGAVPIDAELHQIMISEMRNCGVLCLLPLVAASLP